MAEVRGILLFQYLHKERTKMNTLFSLWISIQQKLFPWLNEVLDPLTEKEKEFVRIAELAEVDKHIGPYRWVGNGRKPKDRKGMALAFIAKAVWNFPTTLALIEFLKASRNLRCLCGWEQVRDLPSESTFSRAFDEFSQGKLPQIIHEAMVKKHLSEKLAGHVSRDSTAIEGREKPVLKNKADGVGSDEPKRGRGRPKKGEPKVEKAPKRLDLQPNRSLDENLADLPQLCDVGAKKDSKGHIKTWIGFKLHLDIMDGDIPVSAYLTSASVHDSQVAIPLAQMTQQRITNLYDLMDSAYDAPQIKGFSQHIGHVPIIDQNRRRGEVLPMDPAQAVRYNERSSAERVNSNLKDNYGGRFVRVRGAAKVMAHLMFGLVALTAAQLFQLLE
jgi:hypothetical protein